MTKPTRRSLASVLAVASLGGVVALRAVNEPLTVDPDKRLAAEAHERGWPTLHWRRQWS